jgi:hypothetical protein
MRRLMVNLGDRMLARFVPRTSVSACTWGTKCGCSAGVLYRRWCCNGVGLDPDGDPETGPLTYWGVTDIDVALKHVLDSGALRRKDIENPHFVALSYFLAEVELHP